VVRFLDVLAACRALFPVGCFSDTKLVKMS